MNRGKGLFGSFRTTLVLSILVGIIVPLSMNFEHPMEWKMIAFVGMVSFGSFWAITFIGLIITALFVRVFRHKRKS